jgi:hypothetical protein
MIGEIRDRLEPGDVITTILKDHDGKVIGYSARSDLPALLTAAEIRAYSVRLRPMAAGSIADPIPANYAPPAAAEPPAIADRSAIRCDGKKWIAFHDYERQPGERGTAGRPEYLVREIWGGHETDAIYTFDRAWADQMYAGMVDQAYVAELLQREAGEWQLIKRSEAPA